MKYKVKEDQWGNRSLIRPAPCALSAEGVEEIWVGEDGQYLRFWKGGNSEDQESTVIQPTRRMRELLEDKPHSYPKLHWEE